LKILRERVRASICKMYLIGQILIEIYTAVYCILYIHWNWNL